MLRDVRVAIVGGGVVGASVAYHLSQQGYGEIVILEKGELSSGSTWHAAGLCPQTARTVMASRVLMEAPALFDSLERETGQSVGFHRTGGIRVATTPDRADELRFLADRARSAGLPYELMGPAEVFRLWPLAVKADIRLGLYAPDEGHVDPSGLTVALAKAAKSQGVAVSRRTRVHALERSGSGDWLVHTDQGKIRAETVVNAGGQWARSIGEMVGAKLPIVPVEHQYVVTAPIAEVANLTAELPLWREPDASYYARQEHDALIVGVYEQDARVWGATGIPDDFEERLLPPDLGRIEVHLEAAGRRIPVFATAGIRTVVNGPDGYTPDNRFILGELPGLRGFFVVAGFNSLGIVSAVGAGKLCAEWIAAGEPTRDVWAYDIRRFPRHAGSLDYAIPKVVDNYARHTAIHVPDEERPVGRPFRTSGAYDRHAQRGAVFGERLGWERPLWFDRSGARRARSKSFRRATEFHIIGRECQSVRNGVGVIDQTSFGKYEVTGDGATKFLDSICSNRLPAVGRIGYTLLLSRRGGIMGELTITRLGGNHYYLVAAAGATLHHLDWLQRHQPEDGSVQIRDETGRHGVLSVMGPPVTGVDGARVLC